MSGLIEGESKNLLEDTDQEDMIDGFDWDNDNDGINDNTEIDEGLQIDDAQEDGKPNWWCLKNPNKC